MTQVSCSAARRHSCHAGQRDHRLHVGGDRRADVDRVGLEARHDRRIHRVGGARTCRTGTARPRRSARALGPDLPGCARCWPCASSDRSRLAGGRHMFMPHCWRSGTKPACISVEIARACARAAGSDGQSCAAGNFSARYSRIASDSHTRIVAVDQDRHLAGGRMRADLRLAALDVERDHRLVERDAGGLHGDPRPHRPGGIVLVADDELERHGAPFRISPRRSGDAGRESRDRARKIAFCTSEFIPKCRPSTGSRRDETPLERCVELRQVLGLDDDVEFAEPRRRRGRACAASGASSRSARRLSDGRDISARPRPARHR